ncbi:MAG: histidinol dehydrogenase, partial [Actinomycetota bacterium]
MSGRPVLRVMHWSAMDDRTRADLLDRDINKAIPDQLRQQIAGLVVDVRERGDEALCAALRTFDGVAVESAQLRASDQEFEEASRSVTGELREAIVDMVDHIRRFNRALLARLADWEFESEPGLMVGERVTPIESAGLFCPSGKASYPSVLAQLGGPAVVAGVGRIAVVVPPKPGSGGRIDAVVLAVAAELGLRDVFRVNGPAGIAALAFGT